MPNISAVRTTTLVVDQDNDTLTDFGDTLYVTVTITNTAGSGAATDVTVSDLLNGTSIVNGSLNVSPLAMNDSYTAVGNTVMAVLPAGSSYNGLGTTVEGNLMSNDSDALGGTFDVDAVSNGTSAQGGTFNLNADGTFTYVSKAGFTGDDSFTYTVRDNGSDGVAGNSDDLTSTATVTVHVQETVWYVDPTAAPGGDGTSAKPFQNLTAINASNGVGDKDDGNDYIYVKSNTSGDIALETGQHLIGGGADLDVAGFHIADDGARTSLTGTATFTVSLLGTGNEIAGIDLVSTGANHGTLGGTNFGTLSVTNVTLDASGTALSLNNGSLASGANTFLSTDSDGGTNNVALTNVTGSVNLGTGTLQGATGIAVDIDGGNGSVDFNGTVSHTGNARAIEITNKTGGTVQFDGSVTSNSASDGVVLDNNDNATLNFNGGVTINTSSSNTAGFTAINGGTVNVVGANNTVNSGTNTAINISNTNIGVNDVTFKSVTSASGGSNSAIILDTTGNAGGLHITGNGTTQGALGGGTIGGRDDSGQDGVGTVGTAIYLNNTTDVQLNGLTVSGTFANNGVLGYSVNGLQLTNSTFSGTFGDTVTGNESAIALGRSNPSGANGLSGNSLIQNVNVSGSIEHNVEIYQQSGSFGLTIKDSNIHDNSLALGSDGIQIEMQGTAVGTIAVTGTTLSNNKSQGIQGAANDSSTLNLTLDTNTVSRGTQGNEGIVLSNGGNGHLNANINHNTVSGFGGTAIFVGQTPGNASSSSLLEAKITNNTVTAPANATNHAVIVYLTSTTGQVSQAKILIDGNNVTQNSNSGTSRAIVVDAPDTGRTPEYHVTVTNNTANETDAGTGVTPIVVQARNGATGHFDVRGNTTTVASGVAGIRVREDSTNGASTGELARGPSASNDPAVVLSTNNPNATTSVLGPVSVINNTVQTPGSTPTPTLPLFADTPPAPGDTAGGDDSSSGAGGGTTGPVVVDDGVLSQGELNLILEAAIQRWEDAGATPEQIEAMRSVTLTVADLGGLQVGASGDGAITIDDNAGGWSWFIDETPADDAEYSGTGTQLVATNANGAAGTRVDLLTVVMHELGHQIGLSDTYAGGDGDELMYGSIHAGERRLPGSDDAAGGGGAPVDGALSLSGNLGTLPDGRTIVVTWRETLNTVGNNVIPNSQSSTVGGSNFTDVLTNSNSLGAQTLSIGNLVWGDTDGDGVKDAGETGIDGVKLTLLADTDNDGAMDDVVLTTTTAGGGLYSFGGLAPGDYVVQVDSSNFGSGQALENRVSSLGGTDPDDNTDGDDNGVPSSGGVAAGAVTLGFDGEPVDDGEPVAVGAADNDHNMSVDFGFRPNQAPTAAAASGSGTEDDASIAGNLSGTDGDGDSLTYTLVTGSVMVDGVPGADGDVSVDPSGTFSYTPLADEQAMSTGDTSTITFTYTVSDGFVTSAPATVTITVNGLNEKFTIVGTADADTLDGDTLRPTQYLTEFRIHGLASDDTLTGGAASDLIVGDDGNDTLYGLGGIDVLTGGAGNDSLDGGTGADTMKGREGDDVYYVDDAGDMVVELTNGGTDEVRSSIAYSLSGQNLENLLLTGGAAIDGVGNSFANVITGNSAANLLRGEDGHDTLSGAAGTDTLVGGNGEDRLDGGSEADLMKGGAGNDTYVVDNAADQVVENASGGTDTIESAINWSLGGQYAEKLVLTGSALNGVGNGFNNTITGNAAVNAITGQDGNDTLYGLGGNDTVSGGDGDDWVDGGTGADTMKGGIGNDTFVVDNAGDKVVETTSGGIDTIESSIAYSLAGLNVENLTLTGANAVNGTGNSLANILTGNSAANVLSGADGADEINGGGGNDALAGGAGADTFAFDTALDGVNNVDSIVGFSSADDSIELDSDVFTGLTAGALDSSAFALGPVAVDADDRIIYNSQTGDIFFDADGVDGNDAVLFAHVSPGTLLTASDFVIVA